MACRCFVAVGASTGESLPSRSRSDCSRPPMCSAPSYRRRRALVAMANDDHPSGPGSETDAPVIPAGDEESPFPSLDRHGSSRDASLEPGESAEAPQLDLVLDIPVRLSVELGRTEMPIREVVNLGRGS